MHCNQGRSILDNVKKNYIYTYICIYTTIYREPVGRFTFPCLPCLTLPYLASICTYLVYVQGKVFLLVEMPSLGYIFVILALNISASNHSNFPTPFMEFLINEKKITEFFEKLKKYYIYGPGWKYFLFVFLLNKFGTSVVIGLIFSSL